MCGSLASRSSQRFFICFFATISFSVYKFFPFAKFKTSAHFCQNQRTLLCIHIRNSKTFLFIFTIKKTQDSR